uniref:Uncharacterized protein n=1 Tax=Gopherus evgoodei TaxID=1825980 RepID=A0A8C4VL57_9SAUR
MMFPGRYGSSPIASTSLTLKYRVFVNKVDSVPPYTIWIHSPVLLKSTCHAVFLQKTNCIVHVTPRGTLYLPMY